MNTSELMEAEEHKQLMDSIAEDVMKRSEKAVSDDELRLYTNLIMAFADYPHGSPAFWDLCISKLRSAIEKA
jgi:hypothetical protein